MNTNGDTKSYRKQKTLNIQKYMTLILNHQEQPNAPGNHTADILPHTSTVTHNTTTAPNSTHNGTMGDNAGIQRNIIWKTGGSNETAEIYKIKYSKLNYNKGHHEKKKMDTQQCNMGVRKGFPVAILDRTAITLMKVIRE